MPGKELVVTKIYRYFNSKILSTFLGENKMGLDPVTSIFNFLSTVEGQKLIDPLIKLNTEFLGIISGLITKVSQKVAAQ